MMTANTGQTQAVFRTNLTQIAQWKEQAYLNLKWKKVCWKPSVTGNQKILSVSSRYQNYDAQELTKI